MQVVFALIALTSVWNLTAAAAQASCSDYVMLGHGAGYEVSSESEPIDHPAGPCRGPQCSRRLPSPLPPHLPARIAAFDAWTGLTLLAGAINKPSVLSGQATLCLPFALAPRIDRPPKAIL